MGASIKQSTEAIPRMSTAGRYIVNRESDPATGMESVIKTAEKMSMYPAKRVSLFAITAPIRPRLEKSAAWTPDNVTSLVVEVKITNAAVRIPRKPPASPRRNCFFILVRRCYGIIKVAVPVPNFFRCGHAYRLCCRFLPESALIQLGKQGILRNIIRRNTLFLAKPGILWTIAQFVMNRPDSPFLSGCGRFPVKKVVVYSDSVPQTSIATKIFINC
jgi:hypothetical protein